MQHLFHGIDIVPCCSQKSLVIVVTHALVLIIGLIDSTYYLYVSIWVRRGFELMSIGWGLMPVLAPYSAQVLGEVLWHLPLWEFKGPCFECSGTHCTYAPTLDNCNIESDFYYFPLWSGFDYSWLHHNCDCCLDVGTFHHWYWYFGYFSSGPSQTLLLGFSQCTLNPFNSCH